MTISTKVELSINQYQSSMYAKLNNFSKSHQITGRLLSIPVSILDVGLEFIQTPLSVIESLALAALNLIGSTFSSQYTLKKALRHAEDTMIHAAIIPIKFIMAPFKLVLQFCAIIDNPERVKPSFCLETFKKDSVSLNDQASRKTQNLRAQQLLNLYLPKTFKSAKE